MVAFRERCFTALTPVGQGPPYKSSAAVLLILGPPGGVPFSLVTFSWARESDPRAGMRVETAGMRGGFRGERPKARSWIPAFAGMTKLGASP